MFKGDSMPFKRFWKSSDGNFALMLALTLPALFLAAGVTVDVSRLVSAKSALQAASDAALLAASHLKDEDASRDGVFNSFLQANLAGNPDIIRASGDLTVKSGLNHIRTQALVTADVNIGFLGHLGVSRTVTVRAAAYESTDTLEVAMVLDNTGSMGASRMKALRGAANALVDILENSESPVRKVKASLVPFVSTVNIKGEGFKEVWIDRDGKAPYNGANFEPKPDGSRYSHLDLFHELGVDWKGCVEARPEPYNLSDTQPDESNPSTLFVPYFAPDNPGAAGKSPNAGDKWNNSYLDSPADSTREEQKEIARYLDPLTARYISESGSRTTGPNYACPTPILPLTDDWTKLHEAVDRMIYWEGGGTNVSEGLAWGMRVLSPGEPYTQGAAFDDEAVSKVLVVFTDGENTVFGASNEPYNTSDYGAYSFLDSGRFGTTKRSTALTNVNKWTKSMCTALKDKGVKVFAVLLGADTKANRELYSQCASQPSYYYPTDDVSELQAVFARIGSEVAQLYLTD